MPSNADTRRMLRARKFQEMLRRRHGFAGKGEGRSNRWDSVDKSRSPRSKDWNPGTGFGKTRTPPRWGKRA